MALVVRGFKGLYDWTVGPVVNHVVAPTAKGVYNWTLGPVVDNVVAPVASFTKRQTVDRVAAQLPQNQHYYSAQRLNHRVGELQSVLADEKATPFTEAVESTFKTIESRAVFVQSRLKELEGHYYRDPRGLIYQAHLAKDGSIDPLLEEQKQLRAEYPTLSEVLSSNERTKKQLTQKKTELLARQKQLCGKGHGDRNALLSKAWRAFKAGTGRYSTYTKLEAERTNIKKELRLINAALLVKPKAEKSIEVVTRARIEQEIIDVGGQRDTEVAQSGVDGKQLGLYAIAGTISALGFAMQFMPLFAASQQPTGPQLYGVDNGMMCQYANSSLAGAYPIVGGLGFTPIV